MDRIIKSFLTTSANIIVDELALSCKIILSLNRYLFFYIPLLIYVTQNLPVLFTNSAKPSPGKHLK